MGATPAFGRPVYAGGQPTGHNKTPAAVRFGVCSFYSELNVYDALTYAAAMGNDAVCTYHVKVYVEDSLRRCFFVLVLARKLSLALFGHWLSRVDVGGRILPPPTSVSYAQAILKSSTFREISETKIDFSKRSTH